MEAFNKLNRQTKFGLISALIAGLVSIVLLVVLSFDFLKWLFLPSVMLMVFVSAYYAFRRQMRGKGALTDTRVYKLAFEVGTMSHLYTFALYFPLYYFFYDFNGISFDMLGIYIGTVIFVTIFSLLMFVWIAVPMYIGVGYIQKNFEKELYFNDDKPDESLLNDDFAQSEIKAGSRLELD